MFLIPTTTMRRGISKMPKRFSCPGDFKELSKTTKRSTYDSNQARTKPLPTRPPTTTRRLRTNETPKCLSNLRNCSGLSKKARSQKSRKQGSCQLTIWQWLIRVQCKLTSRTTNLIQTKKKTISK